MWALTVLMGGDDVTFTTATRTVTVPLPVTRQHLVRVEQPATVTLPDGRAVTGAVATVGTVATVRNDNQGTAVASVDVLVRISDQAALGTRRSAPHGSPRPKPSAPHERVVRAYA